MALEISFTAGSTDYILTINGKAEAQFENLSTVSSVTAKLDIMRGLGGDLRQLQALGDERLGHMTEDDPMRKAHENMVEEVKQLIISFGFSPDGNLDMSKVPVTIRQV